MLRGEFGKEVTWRSRILRSRDMNEREATRMGGSVDIFEYERIFFYCNFEVFEIRYKPSL